jgi:hypothetical protein
MGATESHEVLDWSVNRNHSVEHRINEWEDSGVKNADYYLGKRFCKIPRHLYPQYQRGYIYGYYEDCQYFKDLIEEYY